MKRVLEPPVARFKARIDQYDIGHEPPLKTFSSNRRKQRQPRFFKLSELRVARAVEGSSCSLSNSSNAATGAFG
jgi:hypothetical protein